MLEITQFFKDNEIDVVLKGKIETQNCDELHENLKNIAEGFEVVLDFHSIRYICSSGLREILIAKKRHGDHLKIVGVNEPVEEIFKITGFTEIIDYETDDKYDYNYDERSFKGILESKAKEFGDVVILKNEHTTFTFEELNIASTIVAHDLEKLGVKENDHVGIISTNSISWIITFFAIQKIGALALLYNFSYTKEELASVAKLSDCDYICYGYTKNRFTLDDYKELNFKGFYNILEGCNNIKERFNEFEELINNYPKHYDQDRPSIMIFTSGSTGIPKGVLLSSYNFIHAKDYELFKVLNNQDKILLCLPLFHVFGFAANLTAALYTNALLYVPEDLSIPHMIDIIEQEKITVFNSVPTLMLGIVANPNFSSDKLSSLRISILAGAATTEAQFQMFKKLMPNNHIASSYGMSELCFISGTKYEDTMYHITHTVGCPQAGVQIKIDNPNADGIGEILVKGDSMMTSYYKLSLDKQDIDEDGFIHSGDLGRIEEDGYVVLTGRIKELIIRGGENIMPQEIANAISSYPAIKDVKIIGVPSDYYGEEVACAYIRKDNAVIDIEDLKNFLTSKLAKYKIPSYFVEYTNFPILGSGKVDVISLKADMVKKIFNK